MLTSLHSRSVLQDLNLQLTIRDTTFHIIDSAHGRFARSFLRHMHSFYELHYIYSGKGFLVTDSASYPLKKGDLFIIPPHYYHEQITDPDDNMEEFHISFTVLPLSSQKSFAYYLNSLGFWMTNTEEPLGRIYDTIDEELLRESPYLTEMLSALFSQIFVRIFRMFVPKVSTQMKPLTDHEKRIITIDQFFLFHYATITLTQLAESLSLSKNHACRLIKENYGMTFIQMRTTTRLNAAADLLSSTGMPISAISEQCGFSNPIYFTQEFKKQFRMTPRDYRKQHLPVSQS
ncbi:MAG: AraC family transcriptional regulator [Lachnospiraceae bacterium]|nr:AraC family transcriptional regulator [Lachnospiraceae bacterium]